MIWQIDNATQIAAHNFPLHIYASAPLNPTQLPWPKLDLSNRSQWGSRILPGDTFPPQRPLQCSPDEIIKEFQAGHYLQALALTVCWGGMSRASQYIYRLLIGPLPAALQDRLHYSLQNIYNALDQCSQSIQQTQDIQQSWNLLTTELQWSSVITSKTLHFLCRALGFNQDPAVPIDNDVILKYVWPGFRIGIPPAQRPHDWNGNDFAAYSRYMTAIIEWAKARNWTTTQVEATVYAENG